MGKSMDSFARPEAILNQVAIEHGARVVDLGAGSGHFSFAAATIAGKGGKVYAVDILPQHVERIKNEAIRRHIDTVEVVRADIERPGGTQLPDACCDVALVCNVLFQAEDKVAFLKEAHRLLKDRGVLLVLDWSDSYGGLGPQPERVIDARSGKEFVELAGFTVERDINAGSHHWALTAKKK